MSDNNGWTGKPGVPLNPEWDGAHHWLSYEGEEPGLYEWDGKYWKMGGGHAPMDYVVDHFTYIAPALTPAEVEARVAQARRDALEEAARVVEAVKTWDDHYDYCESCKGGAVYPDSKEVAAAIRALKGEGDG
jgi:hypothetical protein